MNIDDLDKKLAGMKESPLPELPGDLESRVWRSIREAEAAPARGRGWMPSFWMEWMVRPAFAAALVTVTFGVGIVLGSARAPEEPALAAVTDREALFDVFHAQGSGSPYDLLIHRE